MTDVRILLTALINFELYFILTIKIYLKESKHMNKYGLISAVAEKVGISKKDATLAVEATIDALSLIHI